MNDTMVSIIRTYVPIAVGFVLTWIGDALDIIIPDGADQQLIMGLTAVITAVYYGLVRMLERKWPWFGIFLGARAQPRYTRTARQSLPSSSCGSHLRGARPDPRPQRQGELARNCDYLPCRRPLGRIDPWRIGSARSPSSRTPFLQDLSGYEYVAQLVPVGYTGKYWPHLP